MSLIWDVPDDDQVTEFDAHWRDLATRVRESSERDLEWRRTRGYQAVKMWLASALTIGAVVLGVWSWVQYPW